MMGMPITVEIVDATADEKAFDAVFDYFTYIDEKFSTYKTTSEIMKINRGEVPEKDWSEDMKTIFALSEETKKESGGYFDIKQPNGMGLAAEHPFFATKNVPQQGLIDPSGIVKGWAIWKAAEILEKRGFNNFYVDAGGDIQTHGHNALNKKWGVGVKNPFAPDEIVKTVYISGEGVATSGTYIRGEHIYNPKDGKPANEIVSLTVIGLNIYEVDRFATAAFAMGTPGINFIERLTGFEGYMIDKKGIATMTTGFEKYIKL